MQKAWELPIGRGRRRRGVGCDGAVVNKMLQGVMSFTREGRVRYYCSVVLSCLSLTSTAYSMVTVNEEVCGRSLYSVSSME